MAQSLSIIPPTELKANVPPYGRMPLDLRDCLVAQKIYRQEEVEVRAPPPPVELDRKA
jgi:hypothetical protein